MKLVLASSNAGMLEELRGLVADTGIEGTAFGRAIIGKTTGRKTCS